MDTLFDSDAPLRIRCKRCQDTWELPEVVFNKDGKTMLCPFCNQNTEWETTCQTTPQPRVQ